MYPSMKAELAARDGDLRLYFLLGIATWFLFLDHVPHNVVSLLTMRNFGFSGAVDLFVFVGGYTAAILYGRMMLERGFVVAATRVFKRLWQLYAAYIVLFVIYINLIGYVARQSAAPALISEFNVTGIVDHTIRTPGEVQSAFGDRGGDGFAARALARKSRLGESRMEGRGWKIVDRSHPSSIFD